jgi:hypothetical protein
MARGRRPGAGRPGQGFFPGSAYAPYFYSDLGFDSAEEPLAESPSPQIEGPVLLELQGDHWVRITSNKPPEIVGQSYQTASEQASNPPAAAPSAVLVFRDGHKEEIGKYCIMGATIRISTDYWSTGSWTQTVQIPDLDVPATLKLNQERGSKFRLPSGPYEVMIGG